MLIQHKNKIQLESIMQNIDNIKDDIRDEAEQILMNIIVNDSDYNQQKRIMILAFYNFSTGKFRLKLKKNCLKTSVFASNHYPQFKADEMDINNDLLMVLPVSRQDIFTKYVVAEDFTDMLAKSIKRKAKQILKEWNLTALHPKENLRTMVSFLNLEVDLVSNSRRQNLNRTYFVPLNAINAKELVQLIIALGNIYKNQGYIKFNLYPFKNQFEKYFDFQNLPAELNNIIDDCTFEAESAISVLMHCVDDAKFNKLKNDIENDKIKDFNDFLKINQDGVILSPTQIHGLALKFGSSELMKSYIHYYLDYNQAILGKVLKKENEAYRYAELSFIERYYDWYKYCFEDSDSTEYVYVWLDQCLNDADSIREWLIPAFINQEPYGMDMDATAIAANKPEHLVYFVSDVESFTRNMKLAIRQVSDEPAVQKQLVDLIKKYPFKIITLNEMMNDDSIYEVQQGLLPDKTTFLRAMCSKLDDNEIRKLVAHRKIFNTSVSEKIVLHKF